MRFGGLLPTGSSRSLTAAITLDYALSIRVHTLVNARLDGVAGGG